MPDPLGLYKCLKVGIKARPKTIKDAYRSKAKQFHPDAPGGGHDKFLELSRAYHVLSNKELRAKYDETGTVDEERVFSFAAKVVEALAAIFGQVLTMSEGKVDKVDFIGFMNNHCLKKRAEIAAELGKNRKKIEEHEQLRIRINKEGEGPNIFVQHVDRILEGLRMHRENQEEGDKILAAAMEELSLYTSEVDMVRHVSWQRVHFVVTSTG